MNIELLLKIKEKILAEPHQFIMGNWFDTKHEVISEPIPNCGTAACIAGWAISIHNQMNPAKANAAMQEGKLGGYSSECVAEDILDPEQDFNMSDLFYTDRWPEEIRYKFADSQDPVERAQLAAQAIDMFIEDSSEFGVEYDD